MLLSQLGEGSETPLGAVNGHLGVGPLVAQLLATSQSVISCERQENRMTLRGKRENYINGAIWFNPRQREAHMLITNSS